MSGTSNIEWTDATWNPIVGCTIVSPGCTNCYAMKDAWRKHHIPDMPHYHGLTKKVNGNPVWTGKVAVAPDHILTAPLHWRKPKRIFVNSMGDLFHESIPDEAIDKVVAVMAASPQHVFQILTKRAERMRSYMSAGIYERLFKRVDFVTDLLKDAGFTDPKRLLTQGPLKHIWLGVSAERQQEADERIPHLLQTPAAIRFVSAEPLLGPIDFIGTLARYQDSPQKRNCAVPLGRQLLDWVIVGGESGPKARPMHPQWARDLRDQCAAASIAFFHKQNGEFASVSEVEGEGRHHHFDDGRTVRRVGKRAAGRLLDGREHNEFPQVRG